MAVRYDMDISGPEREFHRLGADGEPDHRILFSLEAILTTVFQITQRDVHIETGALKGSGKPKSGYHRKMWEGTITYGEGPVNYAYWEARRGTKDNAKPRKDGKPRKQGDHDMLHSARKMDKLYQKAIEDWFGK